MLFGQSACHLVHIEDIVLVQKTPNPVDVHVGSRMRMRRMLIGMSQEALGNALGLTFQQVQKYEKGANRIGASRLYHISKILDVNISFFFEDMADNLADGPKYGGGFAEADEQSGYVVDFLQSTDGVALMKAYVKIKDPAIRRRILELVRTLANEPVDED